MNDDMKVLLVILAEKLGVTRKDIEDKKLTLTGKYFIDCIPETTEVEEFLVQDFKPRDRSELFFVRGIKRRVR